MAPRTPKEPALKLVGTPAAKVAPKTGTAKTGAGKANAAKTGAAKPSAASGSARAAKQVKPPKAVKPALVKGDAADKPKSSMLKLRDLVESVASVTGVNKKDARLAIEATLDALATALKRGDDLNLPPLGRTRVAKSSEKDGVSTLTLKLRLPATGKVAAKQGLADDGEDS